MIGVVLSRHLCGSPRVQTSPKLAPVAVFHMDTADSGGNIHRCFCVAPSSLAIGVLRHLVNGNNIVITGEAALNDWSGLEVTVHSVLAPKNAGRKRKTAEPQYDDHTRGR